MTIAEAAPTFRHFHLPDAKIDLRVNSNRKLKTIAIKAFLAADLDSTVTRRALLPLVLRRGTRALPDMQSLSRRLEDLYGATLSSSVFKIGEWHVTSFQLDVVNDLFLPERPGLFSAGLGLLRDLIFDPLTSGGSFHSEYVEQEKENLRRSIESLIDDKSSYAAYRCIEEMCANEPYRFGEQGCIGDIPSITAQSLHSDWAEWTSACPLAIYVAGDVDIDAVVETVSRVFAIRRRGGAALQGVPLPRAVGTPRMVKEVLDVQQAKLVIGMRHDTTLVDDDYEASLVMNGILGGFSHSKLFQNVREKASLAYTAASWLERTKGLLFIACGIAADRFEQAHEICLEQVRAMQRGEFTDEEVDSTVQTLHNRNLMLEDNYSALAHVDYERRLHGKEFDFAVFRERLDAVRGDDIVRVAKRLRHDTTYLLLGAEPRSDLEEPRP